MNNTSRSAVSRRAYVSPWYKTRGNYSESRSWYCLSLMKSQRHSENDTHYPSHEDLWSTMYPGIHTMRTHEYTARDNWVERSCCHEFCFCNDHSRRTIRKTPSRYLSEYTLYHAPLTTFHTHIYSHQNGGSIWSCYLSQSSYRDTGSPIWSPKIQIYVLEILCKGSLWKKSTWRWSITIRETIAPGKKCPFMTGI